MRNSQIIFNFTNRVTLLTNEVEKLSDALLGKGNEAAMLYHANQKLQSDNAYLKNEILRREQEYVNLAEILKNRTIEYETMSSNYNRLNNITVKDLEKQIFDLQVHNDLLQKLISQNDLDAMSAKDRFIAKCQELQEQVQQVFHVENSMKQLKEEKLQYIHEYQKKDKELELVKGQLSEFLQYKVLYDNALVDMDLIRGNYSALYMQKEQEKVTFNEQLSVQRDVANNTVEIVQNKFVGIVQSERDNLRQEYEAKIQSVVLQLENHVTTLQNIVESKNQENERMRCQMENNYQRMRMEFTRDIQAREQTILDLNRTNQQLLDSLNSLSSELGAMENSIQKGNLLNRQETMQLHNTVMDLTERIHAYELRCKELKIQNENIMAQIGDGRRLHDQTEKKYPRKVEVDNEEKINYLLNVIDKQNKQLQQRDLIVGNMSRVSSRAD